MRTCSILFLSLFLSIITVSSFAGISEVSHYFDKKNQLSFGLYDDNFSTADYPRPPSPIFWSSSVSATSGQHFSYLRTVYHTEKYFSANVGASLSNWQHESQMQLVLSAFFELRLWLFRSDYFNPYVVWSIAGPSVLTRHNFGPSNLGGNFIFQDYLGVGVQVGKEHRVNLSAIMYHYSNGDLLYANGGFDVPIVFAVGYTF
jgi:hypothetical protein